MEFDLSAEGTPGAFKGKKVRTFCGYEASRTGIAAVSGPANTKPRPSTAALTIDEMGFILDGWFQEHC